MLAAQVLYTLQCGDGTSGNTARKGSGSNGNVYEVVVKQKSKKNEHLKEDCIRKEQEAYTNKGKQCIRKEQRDENAK